MEVEETEAVEIVDDYLPDLYGGFEQLSTEKSTQQLGSILEEDGSAEENAGCVSYQDLCGMENPRNESIHHQAFTRQEDSSVDKCVTCGQPFSNYGELMLHMFSHNQETEDGASLATGTSTGTASKQTEAAAAEEKTEYICYACRKTFSSNYSLQRHIETLHIGRAGVCTCKYCHIIVDSHKLRKHIIESHIRVANYLQHCLVCFAVFGILDTPVTSMNQTSNTHSSFSRRSNLTLVDQNINLMNIEESNHALLTCVDCGSSQVHSVKYKSRNKNCITFQCDQCPAVDIKSCFVKLTCEDERKYRRHISVCTLCISQKDKLENLKKISQNSGQVQAFGQFSGETDTIEISDENEAWNPVSEEKPIIISSDDENVCDTTCRVSLVSPVDDSIEFLGSIKSDSSCDKDDVIVVKEYIRDVTREEDLALKEAEDYIKIVESECMGLVQEFKR